MPRYLKLRVTDEQRANLEKLYAHLALVPADRFDMSEFARLIDEDDESFELVELEDHTNIDCGTICCMVGRGPSAGIAPQAHHESWHQYAAEAFGAPWARLSNTTNKHPTAAWSWLFDYSWAKIDNTVDGGRRRLRLALDKGIPANYVDQRIGKARYQCAG